jgi:hypothetical protein
MHRKLLSIIAATVLTSGLVLYSHDGKHPEKKIADAEEKVATVEGELIDSACYVVGDGEAKGPDHAACARKCLGSGVPAAILPVGSKDPRAALFLLTNPVPLAPHAGQSIKVEGTMAGDYQAFDVKRLYVKEGQDWKEIRLQDEHHKMTGGGHAGHGDAHPGHGAAGTATKPESPHKH